MIHSANGNNIGTECEGGPCMKKSELDVNQYLIRTDLAVETKEAMANQKAVPAKEIRGFIEKERDRGGIKIRTVDITKEGAELSGKKKGAI